MKPDAWFGGGDDLRLADFVVYGDDPGQDTHFAKPMLLHKNVGPARYFRLYRLTGLGHGCFGPGREDWGWGSELSCYKPG